MRYAIILFAALLFGCDDDDLLYADGSAWRNVSLSPGASIPRDMREWDRWAAAQVALPYRDVKTFTPTWTGFGTPPTGDLNYVDLGAFVIVYAEQARTATSNATGLSLTGLPEEIQPINSAGVDVTCYLLDNGSAAWGMVHIDNAGGMQFFIFTGTPPLPFSDSGFTAAGAKGVPTGFFVMYPKGR